MHVRSSLAALLGPAAPAALLAAALAADGAQGAGGRPPPPPEWSSHVERAPLAPGAAATYAYRATSGDAFELRLTLRALPPQLRLVRAGTTPYRLVGGRPTWILAFPGGREVTRNVNLRVRVDASARVGAQLCVTFRQVATNGGVPDVVALPVCTRVHAAHS